MVIVRTQATEHGNGRWKASQPGMQALAPSPAPWRPSLNVPCPSGTSACTPFFLSVALSFCQPLSLSLSLSTILSSPCPEAQTGHGPRSYNWLVQVMYLKVLHQTCILAQFSSPQHPFSIQQVFIEFWRNSTQKFQVQGLKHHLYIGVSQVHTSGPESSPEIPAHTPNASEHLHLGTSWAPPGVHIQSTLKSGLFLHSFSCPSLRKWHLCSPSYSGQFSFPVPAECIRKLICSALQIDPKSSQLFPSPTPPSPNASSFSFQPL